MSSSRTTNFCKNEDCPSSQELLDFQNGDIDRERGVDIRIHMSTCEFCSAEVEFYSRFPQVTDDAEDSVCEIPPSLYELTNALLRNPRGNGRIINARRIGTKEYTGNIF